MSTRVISSISYKDTSDDKVDVALTKVKCPRMLIGTRQLIPVDTVSSLEVQRIAERHTFLSGEDPLLPAIAPQSHLKETEQFKDDYDDNNYSDYVEDASIHAVTNISLQPVVELRAKLRR